MKKDIIIIGAGVVGLMTAYSLQKAGRKVTVIDEGNISDCTSFGNAGLLSAFDKTPLSNPGIVLDTLKLMLKGESPVNIHPKLDYKLFRWLFKFVQSANEDRLKRTLALFEKYGQDTINRYKEMQIDDNLDFDFHHDGMLSVFTEQKSYDKKLSKYEFVNDDIFEVIDKTKIKKVSSLRK
ncbi:MAG: FAD-dependent oxidoreductase [Aliarcobacter sp.]|nr:FAD-dependent oxidoreductase [Aliarcobacter sp.]